jgi:hypothetical protein
LDQVVNEVAQRCGISNDQARTAVQTVLSFVKTRLPAPVASQIDNALGGQTRGGMGGMQGQAQPGMGGMGDVLGGNRP